MGFQETEGEIIWKVHFASSINKVFQALTTDEGRSSFWAEETKEKDGFIEFNILNYPKYKARILETSAPASFSIEYFGTTVRFNLKEVSDGTELILTAQVPNGALKQEMTAGWVSVLMAMKGAVDFGIDLRNHHTERVWENGYLDN